MVKPALHGAGQFSNGRILTEAIMATRAPMNQCLDPGIDQ
jgi:hypothetical protein